ncbi:hypothetical protein F5882DRAFT_296891, partial [Hyaloscypha sp. PMI_1271]
LNIFPEITTDSVSLAIQTGYRQIDCAIAYRNEKALSAGIADRLRKAYLIRELFLSLLNPYYMYY